MNTQKPMYPTELVNLNTILTCVGMAGNFEDATP